MLVAIMNKPGFSWLTPVLCVEAMMKSLVYYRDVLGFEISWQWSEEGAFDQPEHPTFACVTRGDCSVFLCEKGQGRPGAWICLNVCTREELAEVHGQYKASGALILEEPTDQPWGMREMLVKDPDGNTFRIGCRIEEAQVDLPEK